MKSPSDALYAPAKSLIRVTQQIDNRGHPVANISQKVLAEVGEHVPRAIVDEAEDLAALVRVLADRDVEIGDICIEGRVHVTILEIEFRVVERGLRGFAPRVDVTVLAQLVLRFRNLAMRARDRSLVS